MSTGHTAELYREILAANLVRLRNEAGLTQVAASRLLGNNDQAAAFLRRYERAGGNPTLETLERFARLYKTTIPDLLTDHGLERGTGATPAHRRRTRLDVLEREVAGLKAALRMRGLLREENT